MRRAPAAPRAANNVLSAASRILIPPPLILISCQVSDRLHAAVTVAISVDDVLMLSQFSSSFSAFVFYNALIIWCEKSYYGIRRTSSLSILINRPSA